MIDTTLVLPDPHIEENGDMTSLNLALKFGQYLKPDETILLGDFLNFDYISHWTEGDNIGREGKRLINDFRIGNEILDKIDKFTKKKKVFIMGNHDRRLETWIRQHPPVEGLISLEKNLSLKKRGYEIVSEGKVYKKGKAYFVHGWYWTLYHAHKHVLDAGQNIFYGHVHNLQSFTKTNYEQKPIIGQSLGCLCNLNPEYKRNRPNSWVNAFGVFYFLPSGSFHFYVPIIIQGQFVWNGRVFK